MREKRGSLLDEPAMRLKDGSCPFSNEDVISNTTLYVVFLEQPAHSHPEVVPFAEKTASIAGELKFMEHRFNIDRLT